MLVVRVTEEFTHWLKGLRDTIARRQINSRILRLPTTGNFGDFASVGDEVSELRIHSGPGYRVYYTRRGDAVVFLLCGGDKGTQDKDIRKARELAAQIE